MLNYTITYETDNQYEQPVNGAVYQCLVLPSDVLGQELVNKKITHNTGAEVMFSENPFGFRLFRVRIKEPFQHFNLRMTCHVKKASVNPFELHSNLSGEQQWKKYNSLAFKVAHCFFIKQTTRTYLEKNDVPAVLRQEMLSISPFEWLQQLNTGVYNFLSYHPEATNVYTTAREAIKGRNGVCQDYAHIFIGIARMNGIPARYVSGYIHQGVGFSGDSQMHAWVEVFIPEEGWKGFDPTNNVLVDHNYVKVAHGTDYDVCSPFRGVLSTMGGQSTSHTVQVNSHEHEQVVQQQ